MTGESTAHQDGNLDYDSRNHPSKTDAANGGKNITAAPKNTAAAGVGKHWCRVLLLDGEDFQIAVAKNANGDELFEAACRHMNLAERDYFGISFRDPQGAKWWLQLEKKIAKQVKCDLWVFSFEIKFYPLDPHRLQEDLTRYALCLQLRNDILNGKLPCSFMSLALLGSYTVQSELGDYDRGDHGEGIKYIEQFQFGPQQQQTADLLEKISDLHKSHKGQTPAEAESNFLENAKKLAMYGVDLHDAKDAENVPLQLGVCAAGILVYRDRLRRSRFTWPKIIKFSYKRNMFYIKLRPGEYEEFESTISFKLDSHRLSKRLWRVAVENHQFFRLKEPETVKSGTLLPGFGSRFYRFSGRTQHQADHNTVSRRQPDVSRTASRRYATDPRHEQKEGTTATTVSRSSDGLNHYGPPPAANNNQNQNHSGMPPLPTADQYDTQERRQQPTHEQMTMASARPVSIGHAYADVGEIQQKQREREQRLSQMEQQRHSGDQYANDDILRPQDAGRQHAPAPNQPQHHRSEVDHYQTQYPPPAGFTTSTGRTTTERSEQMELRHGSNKPPRLQASAGAPDGYAPIVTTRVETTTYDSARSGAGGVPGAGGDPGASSDPDAFLDGTLISSSSHTSQSQTIETTTYTTEKDGIMETTTTRKVMMSGANDDVDQDTLIMEAIKQVTDMNPDLCVERIEIKTESEEVAEA